jgi:hypothetical protein
MTSVPFRAFLSNEKAADDLDRRLEGRISSERNFAGSHKADAEVLQIFRGID